MEEIQLCRRNGRGSQDRRHCSIKPKPPGRPLRDSLQRAQQWFAHVLDNVDQLIECLQLYAARNKSLHNGAKDHYERHNLNGLRIILIETEQRMQTLAFSKDQQTAFQRVINQVEKLFFTHMERSVTGFFLLNARGAALSERGVPKRANVTAEQSRSERAERSSTQDVSTITVLQRELPSNIAFVEALAEKGVNGTLSDEGAGILHATVLKVQGGAKDAFKYIQALEDEARLKDKQVKDLSR